MVSVNELRNYALRLYDEKKSEVARILGEDPSKTPHIEKVLVVPPDPGIVVNKNKPAATYGPNEDPTKRTLELYYPHFENRIDDGAFIHEFTHAVQRCPFYNREKDKGELTAWLIEGIADYVREVLRDGQDKSDTFYKRGEVSKKGYSQNIAHFLLWLRKFNGEGVKELSQELDGNHIDKSSVIYQENESFDRIYHSTLNQLIRKYEDAKTPKWLAWIYLIIGFFRRSP